MTHGTCKQQMTSVSECCPAGVSKTRRLQDTRHKFHNFLSAANAVRTRAFTPNTLTVSFHCNPKLKIQSYAEVGCRSYKGNKKL